MDRYTSPQLSRDLRDAGLEIHTWPKTHYHQNKGGDVLCHGACSKLSDAFRALDLTEVLCELVKDREGGPLCDSWLLQEDPPGTIGCLPYWQDERKANVRTSFHKNAVEAAGLTLLELLRQKQKSTK